MLCALLRRNQNPCGDARSDDGTENDSHETDNRLIHIFNPSGCPDEIENVHLPNGIR